MEGSIMIIALYGQGQHADRLVDALLQEGHIVRRIPSQEDCDIIVAFEHQARIPQEALDRSRLGGLCYHPSLLPRGRGRDAVKWAVHRQDPLAGGTVFWMTQQLDAGPICTQDIAPRPPRSNERPRDYWDNVLAPLGISLMLDAVHDANAGNPIRMPQREGLATYDPPFRKEVVT